MRGQSNRTQRNPNRGFNEPARCNRAYDDTCASANNHTGTDDYAGASATSAGNASANASNHAGHLHR